MGVFAQPAAAFACPDKSYTYYVYDNADHDSDPTSEYIDIIAFDGYDIIRTTGTKPAFLSKKRLPTGGGGTGIVMRGASEPWWAGTEWKWYPSVGYRMVDLSKVARAGVPDWLLLFDEGIYFPECSDDPFFARMIPLSHDLCANDLRIAANVVERGRNVCPIFSASENSSGALDIGLQCNFRGPFWERPDFPTPDRLELSPDYSTARFMDGTAYALRPCE